jgi:hypothetical protein
MRASFALQSLFSQANSLEYNQIGQLKEVIITPDIQGMRICAKGPGVLIKYAAKVVILPLMKKTKSANRKIHTMNPTFLRLNVKIRLFVGLCVLLRAM